MNDGRRKFTPISDDVFNELCLSILHFTINAFNHFQKVGAKIKAGVREHPAVGDEKQAKIKLAREEMKRKFDEFMKLQLQKKRFAEGNMSRTAFNNLEVFSEITGISVGLLHRFNILRIALASSIKKG